MKKILVASLVVVSLFAIRYSLSAAVKVAPYYSLQLAEGVFVPSVGDWNFSINLLNDLGVMIKPEGKHSFVGFYELKYTGPGLKREEGEKFTDRATDHLVVVRDNYNIMPNYFLKSQIDYMKEYKRTGSNEVWGGGLYDFSRLGGLVSLEKKFSDKLYSSISLQYHFLNFPNYTDILAEYQAGGENTESSTGKQNHSVYQAGISLNYKTNCFTTDVIFQNYTKQKVAVETVQSNGTYYSSDLQKDAVINFKVRRDESLWKRVLLSPEVSYRIKNSNQNYLHFTSTSIATTQVPTYFANYYNYNQFALSAPVSFVLQEKWEISAVPEFDIKSYTKRPPQDDDGNFLTDDRQKNKQFIITYAATFKPNAVTRTTLFYTFQHQASNMEFEKYLPYNYTGNYFGIKFAYTY